MGHWWSAPAQPRVIRNIYVTHDRSQLTSTSVKWPDSFVELQQSIFDLYGRQYDWMDFFDASTELNGRLMRVVNQATFEALVPRHFAVAPDVQLFYVGVSLPRSVPLQMLPRLVPRLPVPPKEQPRTTKRALLRRKPA